MLSLRGGVKRYYEHCWKKRVWIDFIIVVGLLLSTACQIIFRDPVNLKQKFRVFIGRSQNECGDGLFCLYSDRDWDCFWDYFVFLVLKSVDYRFFVITPRSTLTWNGCTCLAK